MDLNKLLGHSQPGSYFAGLVYKVGTKQKQKFLKVLKLKRDHLIKHDYVSEQLPIILQAKKDPEVFVEILEWIKKTGLEELRVNSQFKQIIEKLNKIIIPGQVTLPPITPDNTAFTEFTPLELPKRKFTFNKKSYNQFFHPYNTTWLNERSVEISIIWNLVKNSKKQVLEVGNVLSHYFKPKHDILDKYEKASGVINEDITDYKPKKNYDLVISISTLEHVGWNNEDRNPAKVIEAFNNIKRILIPKGKLIFTIPHGQNRYLDKYIDTGRLKFNKLYAMRRVSLDNKWKQADFKSIKSIQYASPYPWANAITIGIMNKA